MSSDVVELILADHRKFEDLFRELRSSEGDRRTALGDLSALLVAHAQAEETEVYPTLRKSSQVDDEEVEHGAEEHAEGHEALLDLLEVDEPGGDSWDEKLEQLSETITHHLDEEERTILNDARATVTQQRRDELGEAFLRSRQHYLDKDCGRIEYVRELVRESQS
ncbi:hemerythrin domain-containing protein [Saccharopolyspora rhizosphaerae]|uniref:Hemerythrin domain-containing protein n=1 Tax=Saccharopolyspora rhizosphaerae TaxID=2492662 RepID=A0A3R8R588_9PSEU|nr:hemerythrin domain-containing protein [Saccharopolyspora rhizosphaerae]RRO18673.1 hemerythrin domain-containing protein [Saccharopolyspora rhizosphaerae]